MRFWTVPLNIFIYPLIYTLIMKKHWENFMPFHIGVSPKQIGKYVLLPGDPGRVEKIAEYIKGCGGKLEKIGRDNWISNREFTTMTMKFNDTRVSIVSTGIGGSSTSIAMEELMQIGAHTMIRVGSTGSIQSYVQTGDVIITSGSVRLDGASKDLAPVEYPAVAHPIVLMALIDAAEKVSKGKDWTYHVGITASCDTFYQGQCRTDSFTGYIPKRLQSTIDEWNRLNVLNYEMETSTVLTLGNVFGARTGAVEGVIVSRLEKEMPEGAVIKDVEERAIEVAVVGLKNLIRWDKTKKIDLSIDNRYVPKNLECGKFLKKYKKKVEKKI